MLNTTVIKPTVTTVVEVKDGRSPMSETLRLYGEIKQQVHQELLERYQLATNDLRVGWSVFREDYGRHLVIRGRIVLNCKSSDFEVLVDDCGTAKHDPTKIVIEARNAVIKCISRIVLEDLFQSEDLRRVCFQDVPSIKRS